MLEFGWTRHMIRTILVLSFDLCVHFFMVFLCLSHKQKLQESFPLFIGLLILIEITYKLTIYEYIPLKVRSMESMRKIAAAVKQSSVWSARQFRPRTRCVLTDQVSQVIKE